MHAHARSDGRVGHAPVPFMERGSTHAQACSFNTRVSYQPQPAQLAQLAQLSESDSARAHAPAHPTRSDAQGTEGWEREELYRAHAHVWSPFGRDKLQSLFNERNSCSKFVPCQIVSVGRGGRSPLGLLAAPRTPARVFLGPAHRTLGPHKVGVCSYMCVFNNSNHIFPYTPSSPKTSSPGEAGVKQAQSRVLLTPKIHIPKQ